MIGFNKLKRLFFAYIVYELALMIEGRAQRKAFNWTLDIGEEMHF